MIDSYKVGIYSNLWLWWENEFQWWCYGTNDGSLKRTIGVVADATPEYATFPSTEGKIEGLQMVIGMRKTGPASTKLSYARISVTCSPGSREDVSTCV